MAIPSHRHLTSSDAHSRCHGAVQGDGDGPRSCPAAPEPTYFACGRHNCERSMLEEDGAPTIHRERLHRGVPAQTTCFVQWMRMSLLFTCDVSAMIGVGGHWHRALYHLSSKHSFPRATTKGVVVRWLVLHSSHTAAWTYAG